MSKHVKLHFCYHRNRRSSRMTYSETIVKKCLIKGLFYHPGTKNCQAPFEEEPCQKGQWLSVLSQVDLISIDSSTNLLLNVSGTRNSEVSRQARKV